MSENIETLANKEKQEWIVNLPYFYRGIVSAHTYGEALEMSIELISSKFPADQSASVNKILRESDFVKIQSKKEADIAKKRLFENAKYPPWQQ